MGNMFRTAIEKLLGRLLPAVYRLRRLWWRARRPITLGVHVVVVDQDQALLVRTHSGSGWHLPGGGVKRKETLEAAARREVHEETGCTVRIERLLGVYSNFGEWKSDHIAVFVARPLSPVDLRLNIEIAEARYFPLAALPPTTRLATRRRLADFQADRHGVYLPWEDE